MNALTLCAAAVLAGAPLAEVSPFSAKTLPDGSIEYSYDLSLLKSSGGTADATSANGEDKVKAFLKGLPRTVKVTVAPGAPLEVTAGRPTEAGKMTTAFATIADGPMASDNPLEKGGMRLHPPLDPIEPKLLLSAEAVAWQVRQLELSALAAIETDTEALRRELWNKVLELALAKAKAAPSGDAKEGAIALAARLAAAQACLDKSKVGANVRANPDVSAAVDAEISRLTASPDALVAPQPWSWRPELHCAWVRARAIGEPFERSRAGTAAVLTFFTFMKADPKLAAAWEKVRTRRDLFLGAPVKDGKVLWKEHAKDDPADSIDRLNDFIESLPMDDRVPPPLVASPSSPFEHFLAELSGAERAHAFDELAAAVQDGRVAPNTSTWPLARDAWLAPLCSQDKGRVVQFDGDWRERLVASFSALVGSAAEARGGLAMPEREDTERSELKVKLLVPPLLEVEPVAELFARAAESLGKLVDALNAEKLGGLTGLAPDGSRTGPLVATAKTWIPRLKGLAALANPEALASKEGDAAKFVGDGRRLAAAWRSEPAFSKDVREASASPVSMPDSRQHAAIVGVSRRELAVGFVQAPKMQLAAGAGDGFVLAPSEQRYIVPVLVSVEAPAAPTRKPLERQAVKALVEGVSRDANEAEGAFVQAVKP